MKETLSILQHPTKVLAKTWHADGSITPYDEAKYFQLARRHVANIQELSELLTVLEGKPHACLIRGRYVGDEQARAADHEYKEGRVRRLLGYWEDKPLHTCLIEVDKFEPLLADPVHEPEQAIEEYIHACLPREFRGSSFHWQLSNSSGSNSNAGVLKAHVWFWLDTPYTSAQLRAWARNLPPNTLDASVFNLVQVHYTARPQFDVGVVDPVPVRSGYVQGVVGDTVPLYLDESALAAVIGDTPTRQQVLQNTLDNDPVVSRLHSAGLIKSRGPAGQLFITCPLQDRHTSAGGPTSTVYYPQNTGGYAQGAFVCQHDHCRDTPQHAFLEAIGYDPVLAEFEDLTAADELEDLLGDPPEAVQTKDIPEARHLTTDLANAERIMRKFKGRLLVTADRWYAWLGTHWAPDDGEVYVSAVKLSKIIHQEASHWDQKALDLVRKRMGNDISLPWLRQQLESKRTREELPGKAVIALEVAEGLRKWAARSEMRSAIENAMHLAKKMLSIPEDTLDKSPWLLNCANGTIDLRTGKLRKHRAEDYVTHCIPMEYDPTAKAETWIQVLRQITCENSQPEAPVADFLQRWFGYCATGSSREHKMVVHWGGGRNGKSTVIDTVSKVLNGYAGVAPPGLLMASKMERHPTEIASLFGKHMITAHESEDGAVLREGFIKQATGGDTMTARFMRGDFFDFSPTHKLQLLTNHKPAVKGQDAGIWGRLILVPYLTSFGSAEEVKAGLRKQLRDDTVPERLVTEYPGILTWIVQGAIAWYSGGLNPPEEVMEASRAYQTEQDRMLQFVTENCEIAKKYECILMLDGEGLYPTYQRWCAESGMRPLSKTKMLQEITRLIPDVEIVEDVIRDEFKKRHRIRRIYGLKITS